MASLRRRRLDVSIVEDFNPAGPGSGDDGADVDAHAGDAGLHRTARPGGRGRLARLLARKRAGSGKDSPSIARGEWHLGRRYFTLHLRATGSDPYEAAITYGAGEQPRAIGSVFLDTFGACTNLHWVSASWNRAGSCNATASLTRRISIASAAPALAGVGLSRNSRRTSRR